MTKPIGRSLWFSAGTVFLMLMVRGEAFGQSCTYSTSPTTISAPAVGTSDTLTVTAPDPSCSWSVTSVPSWIHTTSTSSGSYRNLVLGDGASGYWRLDELSGPTAADSSGNGHPGTFTGNVSYSQPGTVTGDSAVTFVGGYLDLGTAAPATNGQGAIEMWLKPVAPGAWFTRVGTWPDRRLMIYGGQLYSGDPSGDVYHVSFGNGSTYQTISSQSNVVLGAWTHFVVTWNGSTWALYLNGVLDASGSQTVSPYTTGIPTMVGYSWLLGLDELAVYPSMLTSSQIAAHFNARSNDQAGNGNVTYTIDANATSSARTGTLTVAGQTVTVNQADPCAIATSTNYVAGSGSGTITVTGTSACHWTATSNASWISLPTDTSRYAAQVIADGPDAYWRLNESSGSTIADSSGHNYDGTRYWSLTYYDQVGAVNGDKAIGGYPIVTFPPTPAMTTTGTVEVWVKPTGGDLDWYSRWYGGGAVQDRRIRVYSVSTDQKIHATFSNGSTVQTDIVSTTDLPLNSWSHVVLAWNGSTWSFYINGIGGGSGWQTVVPFTIQVPSYIGQPVYGAGSVDELAIYQTPLTQQQAANHYALSSGAAYTGTGSVTIALTANPTTSPRSGTVTIGSQTVTITQDGQPLPCSYALSVPSVTLDADGGTGTIALTTATSCGWTATSNASWLTVSPTSGTSGASIDYVATNNTTAASRTATITVEGQTTTVTQTPCGFTFTPTSLSLGAGSNSGSVAIAAPSTCGWTATSADPWITLFPGTGRYNDKVIADGANAYWRLDESSGTAAADSSGHGFTGTYLSPTSTSFGAAGAIAGDSAIGGYSRISFPSTAPATTTGTVELWIKPVGTASQWYTRWYGGPSPVDQRIALFTQDGDNKLHGAFSDGTNTQRDIVSVGDVPLNVWTHVALTWNGSAWVLYLNGAANASGPQTVVPFTNGVPSYVGGPSPYTTGGVDELALYAVALSSQQIAQHYAVGTGVAPTGTGNGTVLYTATANPSSVGRSTTITAGGQALTASQAGASCAYTLSTSSLTLTGEAQSKSASLTTPGACAWTASSNVGWITFPTASGSSSASISFDIAANPGADRNGTITIGGQTVAVLQRAVCTYSYTPLNATLASTAGLNTIDVTSSAPTCEWTAGTSTPWLQMVSAGGYAGRVIADHPTAYWRLGPLSSTGAVLDEIAGHDGSIVGNVAQVSGLVSGSDTAMYVDTAAYVDLGQKTPPLHQSGSVEFWASLNGKGPLIDQTSGTHWGDHRLAVFAEWNDDKYHVAFGDYYHAQSDITSASDISFNTPTHVVVTWGQGTWAIYLNGVVDATGTQTVVPVSGAGDILRFGYGPGLTYGYGHGAIDEVAVYEYKLDAAAIAAHYAARTSLPLFGSGVIAYRRAMNPTLTTRSGGVLIEDDTVPIFQSGMSPRLDVNGIITPSTASVVPGQVIRPRVQDGPGNPRDWLGLFPVGADDASGPLVWAYLSGTTDALPAGVTTATISFVMPTAPGTYEVRFFWNDTLLKLATSGPVMVGGPAVTLTSPATSTAIGTGETLTLAASASDYGPGIARVDFAVNGNVVTSATAPPWTGAWGTATDGTYALTAIATDTVGFTATSSAVTITVGAGGSGGGSSGGSSGGTSCTYGVSPFYVLFGSGGASRSITVTAPPGCAAGITSSEPWVALDTAQGTGTWVTTVTVGTNSGADPRVATLHMAGGSVIVEQNGANQDAVFQGEIGPSNDYAHTVFAWVVTSLGQIQGEYSGPGCKIDCSPTPDPPPTSPGPTYPEPPGGGCKNAPKIIGHYNPLEKGCRDPDPDPGGGEPRGSELVFVPSSGTVGTLLTCTGTVYGNSVGEDASGQLTIMTPSVRDGHADIVICPKVGSTTLYISSTMGGDAYAAPGAYTCYANFTASGVSLNPSESPKTVVLSAAAPNPDCACVPPDYNPAAADIAREDGGLAFWFDETSPGWAEYGNRMTNSNYTTGWFWDAANMWNTGLTNLGAPERVYPGPRYRVWIDTIPNPALLAIFGIAQGGIQVDVAKMKALGYSDARIATVIAHELEHALGGIHKDENHPNLPALDPSCASQTIGMEASSGAFNALLKADICFAARHYKPGSGRPTCQ